MIKKVKILHILPNFSPGGAERMSVHLMQKLDCERFEVKAISLFDRVGSDLETMLDKKGIHVWYLGKRLGFDPNMYRRINKVLRCYCPDIVHTHLSVLRYVLPLMIWQRTRVKIHTVHNLAEKEVDAVGKLFHKIAFRMGVVPVAIATEVSRSLHRVYGITNNPLIPNGIPLQYYSAPTMIRTEWRISENIENEEVVYVSVGRLTWQKNHKLLIEAFARVVNVWGKGQLLLVGEGKQRCDLENLVNTLALNQKVRFLGVRTDIPDILSACDVFVLSSDWEGNPLSVMEAMAAGKPVISTAVGGVPELVTDKVTGILVPPSDTTALAAALALLLNEEERRKEMGRAAFKRAEENFCVEKMIKQYEKLYENLLQKGRFFNVK